MGLKIRYQSNNKNQVCVHHLDIFLIKQAKAYKTADGIINSINKKGGMACK